MRIRIWDSSPGILSRNNQSGQLLMSCAPDNGQGLVAQPGILRFDVQICPYAGSTGTVPLFIWWNGTSNPNPG